MITCYVHWTEYFTTLPFSLGREQFYFHFTDEGTELLIEVK